jgi:anti-anti-sigma regulatory factor
MITCRSGPYLTNFSSATTSAVPAIRTGVRPVGEAELSNRQALAVALDAVADKLPDQVVSIVVDVAGLRFADVGAGALLFRLARRAPVGIRVTGSSGAVARVLERLGESQLPGTHVLRATAERPRTELVA